MEAEEEMREAAEDRTGNRIYRDKTGTAMKVRFLRAAPMCPAVRSRDFPLQEQLQSDPEVFIFDDSFSALDYKTDVTLRNALAEKTREQYSS